MLNNEYGPVAKLGKLVSASVIGIIAVDGLVVFGAGTSTWWRHQMETFSALLASCAWNSPVPGEFHTQRPVTRSFDVFFDLRPNKRLSKQWWGWWFETPSCPLWRHCNIPVEEKATHHWAQLNKKLFCFLRGFFDGKIGYRPRMGRVACA